TEGRPASNVAYGSWLCENAKTLERDRTSYSSKTDLALKLASNFNLDDELKNAILAVFRSFAFLHSQGQTRPFVCVRSMSGLPECRRGWAIDECTAYGTSSCLRPPML